MSQVKLFLGIKDVISSGKPLDQSDIIFSMGKALQQENQRLKIDKEFIYISLRFKRIC